MTSSLQNPFLSKWDIRWIKLAEEIKSWSKDPSRKVGCVLTRGKRLVSIGYNGLPQEVEDSEIVLNDKRTKNSLIIHAERNAVLWAQQEGLNTVGCSAFITLHPCEHCAKLLLKAEIKKVVCPSPLSYDGNTWKSSFIAASDLLYKANVPVIYY